MDARLRKLRELNLFAGFQALSAFFHFFVSPPPISPQYAGGLDRCVAAITIWDAIAGDASDSPSTAFGRS